MEREKLRTGSDKAISANITGDSIEALKHSLMLCLSERNEFSHYRVVEENELQLDTFISMKPYDGYIPLPYKLNRSNINDFVLNWYNQVDFNKTKCNDNSGGDGSIGAGFFIDILDFGKYRISIKAVKIYYGK